MGLRFLADMGIAQRVVLWLRSAGHDAEHLREEGLHRLANGEIFLKAQSEGRIVLTFDLDFGEILALSGGRTSVVLFRLNNTSTLFVIRRLAEVIDDASEALQAGAIVVVEDTRHRIRRLPLRS